MENKVILSDVVSAMATRKNITLNEADHFVRSFFEVIEQGLVSDGNVHVKGMGTFKLVEMQPRESVDINTGERILIPSYKKVTFTPDAQLRDQVNRPFAIFQTVVLNEGTPLEEMERMDEPTLSAPDADAGDEEPEDVQAEAAAPAASPAHQARQAPAPAVAAGEEGIAEPDENAAQPDESAPQTGGTIVAEPGETAVRPGETADEPDESARISEPGAGDGAAEEPSSGETAIEDEPGEAPDRREPEQWTGRERMDNVSVLYGPPIPYPAPHGPSTGRKWCRRLAWAALCILLIGLSYTAGYYRIPDFQTLRSAFVPRPIEPQQKPQPAAKHQPAAKPQPAPVPKESAEARARREAVQKYPQVPGGKYLIVGQKGVRVMKRGDTLLKIARQEYGHPDFAQYIIVFNQFENPDVIPLGHEVRLPELMEQTEP